MSEEKQDGSNLPDRIRRDNALGVPGSGEVGNSISSDESRRRITSLENKVEEIANPDKRDDVIVAQKMHAIYMSHALAIILTIAYCAFTWFGKPFPIPSELLLLIATPYGAWTLERVIKNLRSKNGK